MTDTTGTRIKTVRKLRKLTQEQIAEMLGYEQKATISKIENGRQTPSVDVLVRLADILNTTVDYLTLRTNEVEKADMAEGVSVKIDLKEYAMLMKYRSMSSAAQEVFEKMLAL